MDMNTFLNGSLAPYAGITFLIIFLHVDHTITKSVKKMFYQLTCIEILELIACNMGLWTAAMPKPTSLRIFFSAIGYSLQPLLVLIMIQVSSREKKQNKTKYHWLLYIPAVLNIFASFSSFFTDIVYSYDIHNIFRPGPLGYFPQLTVLFYLIVLLLFTVRNRKKADRLESVVILSIIVYLTAAMVVEAIYQIRSTSQTAIVFSTLFYFMYFQSRNLEKKTEKIFLEAYQLAEQEALAHELVCIQIEQLSRAKDIHAAIDEMLAALGTFMKADRVYIFENKGATFPNTFEWCADGVTPEIDHLQALTPDDVIHWTRTLKKGECIVIPDIEKIQESTPAIYNILKPQNITSVIEAPIMVDQHLIGFLGVDNAPQDITRTIAKTLCMLGSFLAITLKNREEHQETLQQANDALKASNEALRIAFDSANRANAAKSEFLSRMSHDIRTPMNAIVGMTTIAMAHIDDRERILDCLGKITASSRHLLGLINEVLDMSRIESGKVLLAEEEFHLSELIDTMLDMIKQQMIEHHHQFNVRITNLTHEDVIGDSIHIQRAFLNILTNAVKYTPDGGTITLNISEKPTNKTHVACYEFIFEDNGIGMSDEFQAKLFQPFERSSDDYTSKVQGTGLGMAITKNIVHMMNGDISVESRLGIGTKITITIFLPIQKTDSVSQETFSHLPVLVVDADSISCESAAAILTDMGMQADYVNSGHDAVQAVTERQKAKKDFFAVIIDQKLPDMDGIETTRAIRNTAGRKSPVIIFSAYDWTDIETEARTAGVDFFLHKPLFKSRLAALFGKLTEHDTRRAFKEETKEIVTADFSGKRVLLVDDNELNREIAVEILDMIGVQAETAENGKTAVRMISEHADNYYQMVFMDIQMPVMNGYEAASAIRMLGRKYTDHLPIIALSANAFAEDVVMARNAGMNEHLAKPLEITKLEKTLERWL